GGAVLLCLAAAPFAGGRGPVFLPGEQAGRVGIRRCRHRCGAALVRGGLPADAGICPLLPLGTQCPALRCPVRPPARRLVLPAGGPVRAAARNAAADPLCAISAVRQGGIGPVALSGSP